MTASSEQRGSDAAPVPEGADQAIDAQLWKALIGGDAKARAAAATRIGERGENAAYAAALAQAAEDDGTYSFPRRRAAGTALGLLGDPRVPSHEPVMLRVARGPFRMGTLAEDQPRIIKEYKHARVQPRFIAKEMPQHEVEVAEFEIGKYPVTNREYAEFVEATGQPRPASLDRPDLSGGQEQPSRGSDRATRTRSPMPSGWPRRRASRTGCRPRPSGRRRLAARTGGCTRGATSSIRSAATRSRATRSRGSTRRRDPSTTSCCASARSSWTAGSSATASIRLLATTPVGIYPNGASPCGALDMAGNAEEWVADKFSLYPGYPFDEDKFDWSAEDWVCRGGAWNRPGDVARTARRHGNFVGVGSIGLRLARDVRA